ncbi:MAG: H/ACA ribonucleoprotein complex subunit GAR1/NAF1 [Thermoplasmatota archaeon]
MAQILLGTVQSTTTDGSLVVSAPQALPIRLAGAATKGGIRIGHAAMDARHTFVGKVSDILGPVAAPVLLIRAAHGAPIHRLVGAELYLDERVPPKRPSDRYPPRGRGPPSKNYRSRRRGD